MKTQVLVHEDRVELGRVETGEEHPHHDEQIDFPCLHPLRQIAIVVLKTLAIDAEISPEKRVIVRDGSA
ncbi:hypothetical protein D3C73_713980 [compost metagenome]